MKSRLFIFLILVCSYSSIAQVTYRTSFETDEEQNEWTFFELGPEEHEIYSWEFSSGEIDEDIALVHFYPVGGEDISDDWVVSPAFDFFGGGEITSLSYQFNGFGTPFDIDTVALYLITENINPELASEKILLRLYSDENYMNDGEIRVDSGISIPPTEGLSYLAFRYKTIINWLDVKFDALELTYNPMPSSNSSTHQYNNVNVFPSPATSLLNIETPNNTVISSFEIFNLQGQLVFYSSEDLKTVNIEKLNSGTYFIRIKTDKGESIQKITIE